MASVTGPWALSSGDLFFLPSNAGIMGKLPHPFGWVLGIQIMVVQVLYSLSHPNSPQISYRKH